MKLRLILWDACGRNCPGCCNKDWDLPHLPVVTDFKDYDQILLTGGEPMLYPGLLLEIIKWIRERSRRTARLYLYTAKVDHAAPMLRHSRR